jgi:hypothetical protein
VTRYCLGAEELVELGKPIPFEVAGRKPFLAGRARLGVRETEAFLKGEFSRDLGLLSNVAGVPAGLMAAGAEFAAGHALGLARNAPSLGKLIVETALLAANRKATQLAAGLAGVLKRVFSESENRSMAEEAADRIASRAPAGMAQSVKAALAAR